MAQPKVSEAEFIELFRRYKSATKVAEITGAGVRSVQHRRKAIEQRHGFLFETLDSAGKPRYKMPEDKLRATYDIEDGVIVVGSDAHYWPGYVSTAHRAFVSFVKTYKPNMVVLNGDIFDGHTISRHHRIGFDGGPSVQQELEEVQARLGDIEAVRPAGCILHRTIGNHDMRFEGKLSNVLPQYEGVHGVMLADHLPHWNYSWSLMVNGDCMIKHRYHNGIHATYNNTLKSGTSMVTGHLHSLKCTPWSDYTGTKYGVDTGTLSNIDPSKFLYLEDNPVNWRSGFVVLTFRNGELLPPELVHVVDEDNGEVFFRGQIIKV